MREGLRAILKEFCDRHIKDSMVGHQYTSDLEAELYFTEEVAALLDDLSMDYTEVCDNIEAKLDELEENNEQLD